MLLHTSRGQSSTRLYRNPLSVELFKGRESGSEVTAYEINKRVLRHCRSEHEYVRDQH